MAHPLPGLDTPSDVIPLPAEHAISPLIAQAQDAFRHDFPELQKTHSGKWVAYHGDQQVGFGDSSLDLSNHCLELGLNPDSFIVRCIVDDALDDSEIDTDHLLAI